MVSTVWRQLTRYMFFGFFVIAFTLPALGQSFHLGVKAGIPITEFFQTGFSPSRYTGFGIQYSAATRRYTVGMWAEWRGAHGIGFEADALFKRMGYIHDEISLSPYGGIDTTFFDVKGSSWDFPILMKYRFGRSRRPFASGGGIFRHIGPVRARGVSNEIVLMTTVHTVTSPIDTKQPPELEDRNFSGLTIGGGFEFGRGWLRFLPELRYTHWVCNIGAGQNALRLNPHQLEFLLGLDFFHRW